MNKLIVLLLAIIVISVSSFRTKSMSSSEVDALAELQAELQTELGAVDDSTRVDSRGLFARKY